MYEKAQFGEDGFEGALEQFPQAFDPKKIQPEFSGRAVVLVSGSAGNDRHSYLNRMGEVVNVKNA